MMRTQAWPHDPGLVAALEQHVTEESEPGPAPMPEELHSGSAGASKVSALPELRSAGNLYDCEHSEIRTLVDGLLCDGLTLFVGRQKSGKSWLALQVAIMIAGGPPISGLEPMETGPVLFGALEEIPARTAARLRKLSERGDWLDRIVFFHQLLPLMGGGGDQLREMIANVEPRLIVLDSLTALVKGGGQRTNDVFRSQYAEVDALRRVIGETRAAALVIHHTRKGPASDVVDAIAGTGGISAAADGLWLLRRRAEGDSTIEVTGREIEERTFAARFDLAAGGGWSILGDGAEVQMSAERKTLMELLRDEGPLSPRQIAEDLGKSRPATRMMLKRMVSDGLVVKQGTKYILSPSPSLSVSYRSYRERD